MDRRNQMAGRAISWIASPNRPSTKSKTLILHFAVDVKRLVEEGKDFCWPRPERCPRCGGLRLKVRRAQRLSRLLAALAIGYILLLALGSSPLGKQLRRELEVLRSKARHGTRRTLSVLSIALMAVTDYSLLNQTNLMSVLKDCLIRLRQDQVFLPSLAG